MVPRNSGGAINSGGDGVARDQNKCSSFSLFPRSLSLLVVLLASYIVPGRYIRVCCLDCFECSVCETYNTITCLIINININNSRIPGTRYCYCCMCILPNGDQGGRNEPGSNRCTKTWEVSKCGQGFPLALRGGKKKTTQWHQRHTQRARPDSSSYYYGGP